MGSRRQRRTDERVRPDGHRDAGRPIAGFRTVEENDRLDNIRPHADFFEAASDGSLPAVSWVMPYVGASEHPPGNIRDGRPG